LTKDDTESRTEKFHAKTPRRKEKTNKIEVGDRPPAGGEPLLIAPTGSRSIPPDACTATNCFKPAAPANVSARGLSLAAWNKRFELTGRQYIALGNSREPLFDPMAWPSSLWME